MRRSFGVVICCLAAACGSKAGAGVPLDASNQFDVVIADVAADTADTVVGNACCTLADALAFLPPGATACGQVAIGQEAEPVYACAAAQFQKGVPFHATFQQQGIDTKMWTTLAGTGDGRLFVLHGDTWGCPGILEDWNLGKTHVSAERCQDAAVADGYGKTWLTCTALVAAGTGCGEPASTDSGVVGVAAVLRIKALGPGGMVPKIPIDWHEFHVEKAWV